MRTIKLQYESKLKEKFYKKEIQEKWKKKYEVFDEDDLRLALSQPTWHFGEWYVARIFDRRGHGVLIEKFGCKNHKRKTEVLLNFFSPAEIETLNKMKLPDLFIYKNDKFFFAEVKKDDDRLSDEQKSSFRKLEKKYGCEVLIYELKEQK